MPSQVQFKESGPGGRCHSLVDLIWSNTLASCHWIFKTRNSLILAVYSFATSWLKCVIHTYREVMGWLVACVYAFGKYGLLYVHQLAFWLYMLWSGVCEFMSPHLREETTRSTLTNECSEPTGIRPRMWQIHKINAILWWDPQQVWGSKSGHCHWMS